MPDISQELPIQAAPERVFRELSSPEGLNRWWTKTSSGTPALGSEYALGFGPGYDWRAKVVRCVPDREFELELVAADDDWIGTRVGFELQPRDGATWLCFHHTGWPRTNRVDTASPPGWALYLGLLRRSIEQGEVVPFGKRLDA
jgi:uncharacterized protein YndB with AHSA1/START domain